MYKSSFSPSPPRRVFQFGVRCLAALLLWMGVRGADCPPVRSTHYNGSITALAEHKARAAFDASVAMTVEAWVYREDGTRCETILSHDYTQSWWLGFCSRLRFYRSGGVAATADLEVPANQWCHVAASYDGQMVRFYINGLPAGEKVLGNNGANHSASVIVGADPKGFEFKGSLDEIRLWSTARTETEIQAGMLRELRNGAGLVAVWDTGGRTEVLAGNTVALGAGATEQVLGILPRDLFIPRAATAINLDGWPRFDTEYAGAERLVVRYHDGPQIVDLAAALVYRDTPDDRALYIGLTGIREPVSVSRAASFIGVGIDPNSSGEKFPKTDDLQLRAYLDTTVRTFSGNGLGLFLSNPALSNRWEARFNFSCSGDLSPACVEFRIPETTLGSLLTSDGLMLGHFGVFQSGDVFAGPSDALPLNPSTWVKATYCDAQPLPSGPRISGVVRLGNLALPGVLLALEGATTRAAVTDEQGSYLFDELPPGDYRILPVRTGFEFTPPVAEVKGLTTERIVNFEAKKSTAEKPVLASQKPSGTWIQFDQRFYEPGESVRARLRLTYDSVRTELHAFAVSTETGDVELLTLKRDATNPRLYRSLDGVPTDLGASSHHDGKLSVKRGEKLSVLYYLDEDPGHPVFDEQIVGDIAFVHDPNFTVAPVILKPDVALTPDELNPPTGGKRIGTLIPRDGWPFQIPIDELIFTPRDGDDLKRFLDATQGQVVGTNPGSPNSPNETTATHLVKLTPKPATPSALAQLRAFLGQADDVFASNQEVLDLWAYALELRMQGFVVAANVRLQFGGVPGAGPTESGAADMSSRTMQNEGPLNVPQVWAFLALWDRDETRIPAAILDVGFAPSPDFRTPLVECDMEGSGPGGMACGPGRAFGAQRVGNSLFGGRIWHGTGVASTLGGRLNNRWTPADGQVGGRAGVGGQVVQPMLYQYGLLSYVFEFGAGIRQATIDGASVINISGGYPCRIVDNLGIGPNICSIGGRTALCAAATVTLATAAGLVCSAAAATAAIPIVGIALAIPLAIACAAATAATFTATAACFAQLLAGDPRDPMSDGVRFATERGVPIVTIAGNRLDSSVLPPVIRDLINFSNQRTESWEIFPAMISPCIVAGATEDTWPFANQHFFGNRVDIWAPIETAYYRPVPEDTITPSNQWTLGYIGGTSAAAPYVAGTIAAMQAVNPMLNPRHPALTPAQRLAIPGLIRGILTNTAWTTAELAAMAPDPATATAVNAGAPQRRNLINPLRAVRAAAAGVISDFASLGYDTRMNFNETTPADAADVADQARALPTSGAVTGTILTILGEEGAPDLTDQDWWRFTMPASSGLYVGRLQLLYPTGLGDLTLGGLRLVRTESIGVETRLTFETDPMFQGTEVRFPVRGIGRADNVYKLALIETRLAGLAPVADRFDTDNPANPVRPNNDDRVRGVPLGDGRVASWSDSRSGRYDTYREIDVRNVNFHRAGDVDWYRILELPEVGGCQPSLEVVFSPGVQLTVYGATRRGEFSVISRSVTSPLVIPTASMPFPPIHLQFENLNPSRPVEYNFQVRYRFLDSLICQIAEAQQGRGASRGRDLFGSGRIPFPCPAPDDWFFDLGDFLQLPGREGDPWGRVINPEFHFFEWQGGGDFGADFELPGNASLRVRLLDLEGKSLAQVATPDLLSEKAGPPDNFAGARTISLRRPSLPPGTYMLEFSQGTAGILIGLNLPRNAIRDGSLGLEDVGELARPELPLIELTADRSTGKELLLLRWPLGETQPELEETESLDFGGNWQRSVVPLSADDKGFEALVPAGVQARFFRLAPSLDHCAEPSRFAPGPKPNPWLFGGYTFVAYSAAGELRPQNLVRVEGSEPGVDVDPRTQVKLSRPCREVYVEFTSQSGLVDFTALDLAGAIVASERILGVAPGRRAVTLRSAAEDIRIIEVQSPNARTVIHKICCRNSDLLAGASLGDECRDFRLEDLGRAPNPWGTSSFSMLSFVGPEAGGGLDLDTRFEAVGAWRGYHVTYRTDVQFDRPAESVRIDFLQFSGLMEFRAFDSAGGLVDSRTFLGVPGAPQTVSLGAAGTRIQRISILSPNDRAYLLRLCAEGSAAVAGTGSLCLDLRTPLGTKPNPYHFGGAEILRRIPDGTPSASNTVIARDGEQGVEIGGGQTDVLLPAAYAEVLIKLAMDGGRFEIEALDAGYRVLDRAVVVGPGPRVVSVPLGGPGIVRLRLKSNDAKGVLAEICGTQ